MKSFTYNYDQPSEYHFSLDSIEMPLRVAEHLRHLNIDLSELTVLDLCAGCGVVGFELQHHLPQLKIVDFVEVQSIYAEYFLNNLRQVEKRNHKIASTQFRFMNLNYNQILTEEFLGKYDVIVCNPPYFEIDQGKLSPSEFKNRCRFYMDSDFLTMVRSVLHALKPNGLAFVLIRPLLEHKKNLLQQLESVVAGQGQVEQLDIVRGTQLMKISKNSPT